MITFADVQNSSVKGVANCGPSSPQFALIVNEVVTRLLQRGDWSGTNLPIRVCVKGGCVTWPRYVGQVRRINACRNTISMRNQWFDFLQHQGPRHAHEWRGWCGQERNAVNQFRAPTYNDIPGAGWQVRVVPMLAADVGATVTIFGTDNNQQPLMSISNGVWSQGITITAAQPFGQSNSQYFVGKIDRVVKSVTQGNLLLYAYNPSANVLLDLAVYEPSETSPSYLRYQLDSRGGQSPCGGDCLETIIALVKLQQVPIAAPTDLVLIDNIGALKLGVKAWKREEADDFAAARLLWAAAVEELNRQLENDFPDDQFSAVNNVLGGETFRNQMF